MLGCIRQLRRGYFLPLTVIGLLTIYSTACQQPDTPTPTPNIEATIEAAVAIALPTHTATAEPEPTSTPTPIPTPTATSEPMATVTATATPVPTTTDTPTPKPTPTPVPTRTPEPTQTPEPTFTSTPTPEPTPTPTSTPEPTSTPTPTPTALLADLMASINSFATAEAGLRAAEAALTAVADPRPTVETTQDLYPWVQMTDVEDLNTDLGFDAQVLAIRSLAPANIFDLYLFCAGPWKSIYLAFREAPAWPPVIAGVVFSFWDVEKGEEAYSELAFGYPMEVAIGQAARSPIMNEGVLEFSNDEQIQSVLGTLTFTEGLPNITLLIGVHETEDGSKYQLSEFDIANLKTALEYTSCLQ